MNEEDILWVLCCLIFIKIMVKLGMISLQLPAKHPNFRLFWKTKLRPSHGVYILHPAIPPDVCQCSWLAAPSLPERSSRVLSYDASSHHRPVFMHPLLPDFGSRLGMLMSEGSHVSAAYFLPHHILHLRRASVFLSPCGMSLKPMSPCQLG